VIPAKTLLYRREKSESGNFKQKQEEKRKVNASNEQHTWNSLFMGVCTYSKFIVTPIGRVMPLRNLLLLN
jgi:hypothetical protein